MICSAKTLDQQISIGYCHSISVTVIKWIIYQNMDNIAVSFYEI